MNVCRTAVCVMATSAWIGAAACQFVGWADSSQYADYAGNYVLAVAAVLTIYLSVTRYVVAPRAAYRMGWRAARSLQQPGGEVIGEAEVISMDEYRRRAQ